MEDNKIKPYVWVTFEEAKESPATIKDYSKEEPVSLTSEETKESLNAMEDNSKEIYASPPSEETKETLLKRKRISESFDSYNNLEEGISFLSNNCEVGSHSQQETEMLLKEYYNNLLNMPCSPSNNCKATSSEAVEKFLEESYNNLLNMCHGDAKTSNEKKRKTKKFSKKKEGGRSTDSQAKKSSNSKSAKSEDHQLIDIPVTYEDFTSRVPK